MIIKQRLFRDELFSTSQKVFQIWEKSDPNDEKRKGIGIKRDTFEIKPFSIDQNYPKFGTENV